MLDRPDVASRTLLLNSPLQLGLEAAIDGLGVRSLDAEVVLIDPALRRVVSTRSATGLSKVTAQHIAGV